MFLLYDRQPNKALPAASTIFEGAAPYTPLAFFNPNSRQRLHTIWNSGVFEMGSKGTQGSLRTLEVYIPMNAQTQYAGILGVIANIESGSFIFGAIAQDGLTSQSAQFSVEIRTRFIDGQIRGSKKEYFGKPKLKGSLHYQ